MRGFLAGIALATATQQVVEIRCKPIVLPLCDNALKMHFENGVVPNRCKTT